MFQVMGYKIPIQNTHTYKADDTGILHMTKPLLIIPESNFPKTLSYHSKWWTTLENIGTYSP